MPVAARRAFVLSVWVAVAGTAVAVLALAAGLQRVQAEVARASVVTEGRVVQNHIGDEDNIKVEWRDTQGRRHRQVFGVYNAYDVGDSFELRYDPDRPAARAYPNDPDETDYEDGYYAGFFAFPVVGLLLVLVPVVRRYWWRRTLARPVTRDVPATVMDGHFNASTTSWLVLEHGGQRRWQMVMWDPALDATPSPLRVDVHGNLDGRKRVVPVLRDGTALVSLGRLRHREPGSYSFEPRAQQGASLAESVLLPAGARLPPPAAAWRTPLLLGALGAAIGFFLGWGVFTDRVWVGVSFAAGMAVLAVESWALTGAER